VETFSKEVADVAEDNEDEVADVCREEDVVWRVGIDVTWHRLARRMLRRQAVFLGRAVAKLSMNRLENLLRRRRPRWERQTI